MKKFKNSTLIMLVLSIVLSLSAIYILSDQYIKDTVYDRIDKTVDSSEEQSQERLNDIDFTELLKANKDVLGWLIIYNKSGEQIVSYPVVKTREGDPEDYYLYHDVYRNDNYLGCLFTDQRCNDKSTNILIYGHHMNNGKMFSNIHDTFVQSEFDKIDKMEFHCINGKIKTYYPIFAKSVYKDYPDIQRFNFDNEIQLRDQMKMISSDASAKSSNIEEQLNNINDVITLVTCSYNRGTLAYRTLLVFGIK